MTNERVTVLTVAGEMSAALRDAFDDVDVAVSRGVTRVSVRGDTSVVYGVIRRVEALGLELLDVDRQLGP